MSDERVEVHPKNKYGHIDRVINLILENESEIVAEIGVWQGGMTKRVLQSPAAKYIKEYWAVDPLVPVGPGHSRLSKVPLFTWEENYRYIARLMMWFPQLKVLRLTSERAAEMFYQAQRQLDFVYIDADHHYLPVLMDIKYWMPLIKPGGILAGHDYGPKHKGLIRAVDEVFGDDKEIDDNVWIKRL